MKVYTLWEEGGEREMPWLVASIDEYSVEENGWPEDYEKEKDLKPNGRQRRELLIEFPDEQVLKIFKTMKAKDVKTSPIETPLD
jgi:hypothetical protein